jgi:DNA-binding transcriptional ArsR family regulator
VTGGSAPRRPVTRLAALLADDTRAGFCLALLDGRAWTAGELARHAGVAASTASEHLNRLLAGGLLVEARQGRHRYLRLAGPEVARLVEDLAGHAAGDEPPARSLRAVTTNAALARARTCYDHVAGRLGVLLLDGMADRGLVDRAAGLSVTPDGRRWLDSLGLDVAGLQATGRPLVRDCLDWTERRPHLAGAAGAALCRHFMDNDWLQRRCDGRALVITGAGEHGLRALLGIGAADLEPAG